MQIRRTPLVASFVILTTVVGLGGSFNLGLIPSQVAAQSGEIDQACRVFDAPAVVTGPLTNANFSVYPVDHARSVWTAPGFVVEFPAPVEASQSVPPDVHLVYRDAEVPGVLWLGVRASWLGAPDVITFNKSMMDPATEEVRKSVAAHETGHALGLGDGNPNTSANMLMRGGAEDAQGTAWPGPQDWDKQIYCLIWGGDATFCQGATQTNPPTPENPPPPLPTPDPSQILDTIPFAVFACTRTEDPAVSSKCKPAPVGSQFRVGMSSTLV